MYNCTIKYVLHNNQLFIILVIISFNFCYCLWIIIAIIVVYYRFVIFTVESNLNQVLLTMMITVNY